MAPGRELSRPWGGFLRVPSHSLRASCVRTVEPWGQTGPQRSPNPGAFQLGSEEPSGSRVTALRGPRPLAWSRVAPLMTKGVMFCLRGDKRSFHHFRKNACKQLVLVSCPPRGGLPTKSLGSPCCPLLYAEPTTASWSPEGPSGSGVQGLRPVRSRATRNGMPSAAGAPQSCHLSGGFEVGLLRVGKNSQSQRAGRGRRCTCSRIASPHPQQCPPRPPPRRLPTMA